MVDIIVITKWFKKNFNRVDVCILLVITVIFFLTRLVNLTSLPIFGDEGIYIHWAKIAWHDASWRFVSLTDGKQPLQTWATIPLLKLFPTNALLAGRLFSVFSGFAALSGIFCLLFYLFGKRAAYFGTLVYVLTPYFIFYDRMALEDSAVNAGFIWILFLSVLLANLERLDLAFIFGFISGLSLLVKSSVRVFVGLVILAPILFFEKNLKKFTTRLVNFLLVYGIGAILALIIYNIQRLSPFLHFVEEKNKTFVMTFGEFIKTPFTYVRGNIGLVPYYVLAEGGIFLFVGGLMGLLFSSKISLSLVSIF